MPTSNGSLVVVIKPKAKENFYMAAIMLHLPKQLP
jgi:hypothetical protein